MSDNSIKKRYDFILVFDVKDGNPNGDPDAGNLPRIDPETGCGLVTDVCLKRKVRNFVQIAPDLESNGKKYGIYVKEKAVLGRSHFEAFQKLGISTGEESRKSVPKEVISKFDDLTLPEGISFEEGDDEDSAQLIVAPDADKKVVKGWLKETKPAKEVATLINAALRDAKPRKPSGEETSRGRTQMCDDFYDIRTFGAVMSLKSAPNCGQVRGPVQMTFGRSVDPIVVLEHSITRMAVATEAEAEKQSGDNRTMGRKNTVPYGLYVSHGFVSPHLAAQTGFSNVDLKLFWQALMMMFEHDRSAARGEMASQKLFVFEHESPLGNAPAHKLFERVRIERKDATKPPRAFSDYTVTLDKEKLPTGITLHEML